MPGVFLSAATLDTGVITELLSVVTSVIGVLTTKPLAYFFYASLASVAIGIFAKLKFAA